MTVFFLVDGYGLFLFSDNYLVKDQIWQNVAELEVALAHEAAVNIRFYRQSFFYDYFEI
jgi:hypothetical protein